MTSPQKKKTTARANQPKHNVVNAVMATQISHIITWPNPDVQYMSLKDIQRYCKIGNNYASFPSKEYQIHRDALVLLTCSLPIFSSSGQCYLLALSCVVPSPSDEPPSSSVSPWALSQFWKLERQFAQWLPRTQTLVHITIYQTYRWNGGALFHLPCLLISSPAVGSFWGRSVTKRTSIIFLSFHAIVTKLLNVSAVQPAHLG